MVEQYGPGRVIHSLSSASGAYAFVMDQACIGGSPDLLVELGVTSQVTDEWIRVENTPLVRIEAVDEFEELVHVFCQSTFTGGGSFRDAKAELRRSGSQASVPVSLSDAEDAPDFYELEPGETEWFRVDVDCLEPGRYVVQFGVKYTYQGKEGVIWARQRVIISSPERYYQWRNLAREYDLLEGLIEWDASTGKWQSVSTPTVYQWVVAQ
jgi:hypothetical protein